MKQVRLAGLICVSFWAAGVCAVGRGLRDYFICPCRIDDISKGCLFANDGRLTTEIEGKMYL